MLAAGVAARVEQRGRLLIRFRRIVHLCLRRMVSASRVSISGFRAASLLVPDVDPRVRSARVTSAGY